MRISPSTSSYFQPSLGIRSRSASVAAGRDVPAISDIVFRMLAPSPEATIVVGGPVRSGPVGRSGRQISGDAGSRPGWCLRLEPRAGRGQVTRLGGWRLLHVALEQGPRLGVAALAPQGGREVEEGLGVPGIGRESLRPPGDRLLQTACLGCPASTR